MSSHESSLSNDLTTAEELQVETHSDDDCIPDEGEGTNNCDNTRTTNSRGCDPGDDRNADQKNTGDSGSDDTPANNDPDSGSNGEGTASIHSPTTESSTETSEGSEQMDAPGSGMLPDINSPMIALLGLLCVVGGLIALIRQ
ncbi:hypothetical protein [Haladaptatus pallidirubidus]|uniref:hypothetical protein n=1 Tax=Haladaptatus pallidirubidus TaxID=1008152 RepID=UPI0036F238E1